MTQEKDAESIGRRILELVEAGGLYPDLIEVTPSSGAAAAAL